MIFSKLLGKRAVIQQLGSTVVSQGILSAANFFVAFILLRRLGDGQYGYYVLAAVTLILLTSVQNAYFQPSIIQELARMGLVERKAFIGGLVHGRNAIVWSVTVAAFALDFIAWYCNILDTHIAMIVAVGTVSAVTTLYREFFRGLLLAHHQAPAVLRGDIVYATALLAGALLATVGPYATVFSILAVGVAASLSAALLARSTWNFEPWNISRSFSTTAGIAIQGAWSVFGAAVHWSFSQGYTYMVAALLDVKAVGALAATRLLLMPINVLSSGVNQSTYPMVSRWHEKLGYKSALSRTASISGALLVVFCIYVALIWAFRVWLFDTVIHKTYDNQGILIGLWSTIFLVTAIRDQFVSLLAVRSRLKDVGKFTFISAALAIVSIWYAIPAFGAEGALIGILVGEVFNVVGLLYLSLMEIGRNGIE